MLDFLFFILYIDGGHEYESSLKRILIQVEQSTQHLIVESSVENIAGESTGTSAFSLCKNVIKSVDFAEGSLLKELGIYLFSETNIQSVDFSNCLLLKTIPYCNSTDSTNKMISPNIQNFNAERKSVTK